MPSLSYCLALALCASSLWLGGCAAVHDSQEPQGSVAAMVAQPRMQAASQWEALARREAERMLENERLRVLPLYLLEASRSGSAAIFQQGFRDLLTSELVGRGARISTTPEHAVEVRVASEVFARQIGGFLPRLADSLGMQGDDELIVTLQVVENQRVIYSSSSLYYIDADERRHYEAPRAPLGQSAPLLPMIPVTDRW